MATILDIIGRAALVIGSSVPSAVFGSSDREALELGEAAHEAADHMAEFHDWQRLKRLATMTGDGSTTAFDLPSDFLRMPKDQRVWSSAQETPMTHVLSHDDWLELDVKAYELVIRAWTILGGEFHTKPALDAGETAKFYYQSRMKVNGGAKEEFSADEDTFDLDDRVLKLGIIWRWKANKGLDYAEDMVNYEMALATAVAADKGSRTLAIGRGTYPRGVSIAYPQAITP